jgi:hypothetical protein
MSALLIPTARLSAHNSERESDSSRDVNAPLITSLTPTDKMPGLEHIA